MREALALNPAHEDSRYYLANCLAAQGDVPGAIAQLDELARLNPQSHRAWQRRDALIAAAAGSPAQLAAAEESLDTALRINPEETGTLLLLGETALARGRGGPPLRAGRPHEPPRGRSAVPARVHRLEARQRAPRPRVSRRRRDPARGREWKPRRSVSEGDVRRQMYAEAGFLSPFWERWNGSLQLRDAFRPLESYLAARYR